MGPDVARFRVKSEDGLEALRKGRELRPVAWTKKVVVAGKCKFLFIKLNTVLIMEDTFDHEVVSSNPEWCLDIWCKIAAIELWENKQ